MEEVHKRKVGLTKCCRIRKKHSLQGSPLVWKFLEKSSNIQIYIHVQYCFNSIQSTNVRSITGGFEHSVSIHRAVKSGTVQDSMANFPTGVPPIEVVRAY